MAQTQSDKESKMQSKQERIDAINEYKNMDIVDLIIEDHKPLKELIEVLKSDAELEEKFFAFEEFAPLLVMHSKPEEQTVYVDMKLDDATREEGFEGDVEHQLADQLVEEIRRTKDEDLWMARVKVLAELVEHHIEEEEDELLPKYKQNSSKEERLAVTQEFIALKQELADQQGEDSPSEISLENIQRSSKKH